MDFLDFIFLLTVIMSFALLITRRAIPAIVRHKAKVLLDDILFPNGSQQKVEVINTFHEITAHRFKNEEILDYYYKIKGLRTLGKNCNRNFCLKKYLLSPTPIKLNYFEQHRFYDTFLLNQNVN